MSNNKKGSIPPQDQASINKSNTAETKYIADITNTPFVDGQCAEVLSILRKKPTNSFEFVFDHLIPRISARIYDLREKGFNVSSITLPEVVCRGRVRPHVALYCLGNPEWPRPGFLPENNDLPPAA